VFSDFSYGVIGLWGYWGLTAWVLGSLGDDRLRYKSLSTIAVVLWLLGFGLWGCGGITGWVL